MVYILLNWQAMHYWSPSTISRSEANNEKSKFCEPAVKFETNSVGMATTMYQYPKEGFFRNYGLLFKMGQEMWKEIVEASGGPAHVIGHVAAHPAQYYYYAREASSESIKNICEIGFGPGMSIILHLIMNPHARVYVWDLYPDGAAFGSNVGQSQRAAMAYFDRYPDIGARFVKLKGDSKTLVPEFAKQNPDFKCDLVIIDGDHTPPAPYTDIKNMQALSHKDTVLLMDDVNMTPEELDRAVKDGILTLKECLLAEVVIEPTFKFWMDRNEKKFCSAHYNFK
jgi:hypothetical protein